MPRNPNWTTDEHILALNLYFESDGRLLEPSDEKVIELSNILNSLPIHSQDIRSENFRNPVGVSMKLGNFRRLDPAHEGSGLSHGADGEVLIWEKYFNNRSELKDIVDNKVLIKNGKWNYLELEIIKPYEGNFIDLEDINAEESSKFKKIKSSHIMIGCGIISAAAIGVIWLAYHSLEFSHI